MQRYKQYLFLLRSLSAPAPSPRSSLSPSSVPAIHCGLSHVPTFDIHLMILSHLVSTPHFFERDILRVLPLPFPLPPTPSLSSFPSPLTHSYYSPLFFKSGDENSRDAEKIPMNVRAFGREWKKLYGEIYPRAGTLYRGVREENPEISEEENLSLAALSPPLSLIFHHCRFFDGDVSGQREKVERERERRVEVLVCVDDACDFALLDKDKKNSTREVRTHTRLRTHLHTLTLSLILSPSLFLFLSHSFSLDLFSTSIFFPF